MIAFSILFSITMLLRILVGVFVEKASWLVPLLAPLTGLSIFFGVMAVLFIVVNIIKISRK